MKFVDYLNDRMRLGIFKPDYQFECTYMWSVLSLAALFLIGVLGIGLVVVSVNLEAFNPDLLASLIQQGFPLKSGSGDSIVGKALFLDAIVSMGLVAVLIYLNKEKVNQATTKLLDKYCKRISY